MEMSDDETEAVMTRLNKLNFDEMLRNGDGGKLVERLANTQADWSNGTELQWSLHSLLRPVIDPSLMPQ